MKKNYYEILQVDKNASQEIIEKAYKILAKKYHPDLKDDVEKKYAEEALKTINEAYETLSNPQKRLEYDKSIKYFNVTEQDIDFLYNQNKLLKEKLNKLMTEYNNMISNENTSDYYNTSDRYQNNLYNNINQNHYYTSNSNKNIDFDNNEDQYNNNDDNLFFKNFRLRNLKFLSSKVKFVFSITLVIIIIYILWHLPFVKNFFDYLYNNNFVIKYFVDFFSSLFNF